MMIFMFFGAVIIGLAIGYSRILDWCGKLNNARIARKKYMENKELIDALLDKMQQKSIQYQEQVNRMKNDFNPAKFSEETYKLMCIDMDMDKFANSIKVMLSGDSSF
ncbi:MAG: hypothetical protein ACHQVS_00630 [Candidatus Babeliales bacterium]